MKRFLMICGLLLAASPVAAQVPGVGLIISPKVGMYHPLGRVVDNGAKIDKGVAFGASVELDLPLSPINVRVGVDATKGRDLITTTGTHSGETDMLNIVGDLVLRPIPRIFAQPYLLAGGGFKKYSGGLGDNRNFTGHVGAGVDVKFGPLGVVGEVSDYISRFKNTAGSKLQNDIFVMAGLRFGLL